LQDKLDNMKAEIEAKTTDITTNTEQLTEIKDDLAALIKSCEDLYNDYDMQRIQVLELKNNRKNVSITSAWDTANSWGAADEPADEPVSAISPLATSNYAATPVVDTSGPAPPGFVKYRAVFEFQARNADEITFNPGDIIMVPLEHNAEPGWLGGEINGHTGWFPESYVEKVEEAEPTYDDITPTATTESYSYDQQSEIVDNNTTDLG
jgi:intersectin